MVPIVVCVNLAAVFVPNVVTDKVEAARFLVQLTVEKKSSKQWCETMGRRELALSLLVALGVPTLGLDCTNITQTSRQDAQVEISFPVISNAAVSLHSLPTNGTLYGQELLGAGGPRVQGEEINTVPFAVSRLNVIYYRPFPKHVSLDAKTPLSEFFYR